MKNKDITLWNTKTLATRRALLHQESLLTIPFLVDDLVRLGRFPYPESKTNDVIIDICLKKVGMQHYKDRIYTSLSGGEKQRVNLARILAQLEENGPKSKVLMLDEPALIWSVIWGFSCRDIFCVERYCLNWLEWILLRYGKSGFEFAIR